jgi:Na+-driven multidrug efflux pump
MAAGGTGQFLIQSASWIFLTRILSTFGSEVVAGYTIAIRIIIFTILPSWGMSNAAATLVGQNLGAGKPERAETSVWRTAFYNMIFLLLVGLIFAFFAKSFVEIFSNDPIVVANGVLCLQIVCLGYIFFGYGMVIGQSLNGAGDTLSPTIINFVCFWLLEIPLAYFLAKTLDWGPSGVFWSIAISESILAVVAIFVFRRGRWKRMTV